jgi:NAD(P)-dependent dehydrogenase (short-subunit alcohol dehydrogenase family)
MSFKMTTQNPRQPAKYRLQDRHALVFGAGSMVSSDVGWSLGVSTEKGLGVGQATALVYARNGAIVTCVDKNLDAARETAALIEAEGGQAFALACDVTKSDDVKAAVEAHMAKVGRVDILHNNVGIVVAGGPVDTSEEDFDRVIAVNLKSMFLTCKFTLPIMQAQRRGAIVNISSIAGLRFSIPWIAYNASKGGVNALTMGIAAQYASTGIRCNAVAPGLLSTPMVVSAHQGNHADFQAMMRARDASIPMGWQGEGWDVGEASVFLASDEARFITGQVLVVDGGSTAVIPTSGWLGQSAQAGAPNSGPAT